MKKTISLFLVLVMALSMLPAAFAASEEAIAAADKLYELGLFQGVGTDENGRPIYDLDRAPTRHEAVTMLVRLLGKESEAKEGTWTTPFTDVAEWAKPYVGYAYTNGLTNGISDTAFGGNANVSATQYLTLVLRALGYTSGTDFQWDKAWELSDAIGITDGRYHADTKEFLRGDVAIISESILNIRYKNSKDTLLDKLVKELAVDQAKAKRYQANPINAKNILLNETSLTMHKGQSRQLTAKVVPENAREKKVEWNSSAPEIVSVSSAGLINAKKLGEATITATTSNGRKATCKVSVTPISVQAVVLDKTSAEVVIGESITLSAVVKPSNAENKSVSWTSSDPSVATVDNGCVTGLKMGSATITAIAGGQKAACSIYVVAEPIVFSGNGSKEISNFNLPHGAYYLEYTHQGKENFVVDLYHGFEGSDWDLLANDIGNCTGRRIISDTLDGSIEEGLLKVEADEPWTIAIKTITGTSSTNLEGSGNWVSSGSFLATKEQYTCSYSGESAGDITVEFFAVDGSDWKIAVEDTAPCSGEMEVTLNPGSRYIVAVACNGNWAVDLGVGDPLQVVASPAS